MAGMGLAFRPEDMIQMPPVPLPMGGPPPQMYPESPAPVSKEQGTEQRTDAGERGVGGGGAVWALGASAVGQSVGQQEGESAAVGGQQRLREGGRDRRSEATADASPAERTQRLHVDRRTVAGASAAWSARPAWTAWSAAVRDAAGPLHPAAGRDSTDAEDPRYASAALADADREHHDHFGSLKLSFLTNNILLFQRALFFPTCSIRSKYSQEIHFCER